MSDSINTRKLELHNRIEELETSLAELGSKLKEEEAREQHAAIDDLETYLEAIDNKYENLRDFWKIVAAELRELFDGIGEGNNKQHKG